MAAKHAAPKSHRNLTRRGFLTGVGVGTAVFLQRPVDALDKITTQAGGLQQSPDRLGRIFALPPFADLNSPTLRGALMDMGAPGSVTDAQDPLEVGPVRLITEPELSPNNLDNPNHTAGTTFVGQFLDHDMTFDLTSRLGEPLEPEQAPNTRTPGFDLDSVYGAGPNGSPGLYDPDDSEKFLVESNGVFEDLPRQSNGVAIVSDERNDENVMIGGLHVAFLLFHNRVVELLRDQGQTNVFAEAQQLVRWHYQWMILHEFLPLFVGQALVDNIIQLGRFFYRPPAALQFIPVEFQGACYRFGHSMVRPSYRANLQGDPGGNPDTGAPAFFGFVFDPAGAGQADPVDLRGGARAPRRFIGWQTFFDFGGNHTAELRPNKVIDTHISTPLFDLPRAAIPGDQGTPTALPQRNLLRHVTWSLPSGQGLAQAMGITPVLQAQDFPELQQFGHGLPASTPLWYYALKEAELLADGARLAGVGARIVGEVFIGLLQLDPLSYLNSNPNWVPTLPQRGGGTGDWRMVDLLTFAGVDPDSRGQ